MHPVRQDRKEAARPIAFNHRIWGEVGYTAGKPTHGTCWLQIVTGPLPARTIQHL